ncbi:MAG: DMT family transporter [Paracoccaceae bacterium]|nr:DMT family transporter [Paracoccaceae bacterium]
MVLWIPVTFAAALVQTLRFMLQRQLRSVGLSTGGATFSRFVFAAPLAAALAGALALGGAEAPALPARFWAFALAGGIGQIVATFCTVALFHERNFAVGIGFTKTETVLVAAFSALVLGEHVTPRGLLAIAVGFLGVLFLTRAKGAGEARVFNRATLLGLMAGGFFGASAIGYRGATLELLPAPFFFRAALTLACVTALQTLAMGLWLGLAEPGELARVARAWRRTLPVGVTGMLGSLGWFTAFSLQNAAYVRAVGQVEVVFTILASWLVFRERLTLREFAGIALVVASLLLIVLALE